MKSKFTPTPPAEVKPGEVLDDASACVYLATNPRMLRKMRYEYALPIIRISSKSLRYRRADLEEWLARRRVQIAA